jgi:hypothetical protein
MLKVLLPLGLAVLLGKYSPKGWSIPGEMQSRCCNALWGSR